MWHPIVKRDLPFRSSIPIALTDSNTNSSISRHIFRDDVSVKLLTSPTDYISPQKTIYSVSLRSTQITVQCQLWCSISGGAMWSGELTSQTVYQYQINVGPLPPVLYDRLTSIISPPLNQWCYKVGILYSMLASNNTALVRRGCAGSTAPSWDVNPPPPPPENALHWIGLHYK